MFRTTATRAVSSLRQPSICRLAQRAALKTSSQTFKTSPILSLALRQQAPKSLVRYQSTTAKGPVLGQDFEREALIRKSKIHEHPEFVSSQSSVHNAFSETAENVQPQQNDDVDMSAGIKSDFKTIVETFSLNSVPKQALYMGLAGVVPYLATSLATVILSFDIQYEAHHGQAILFSNHVAENLLHIIEPLQLGYGASIISFLGAIHWGFEWAGYGGQQGYPRYMIGVVATAVAWPTILLSAEIGLITQFLAFTFLYYTDSRAARAGWAPRWYGIYRFVLTFIVGLSIVASLIGRGQIADLVESPTNAADRMRAIRDAQLLELEESDAENKARSEGRKSKDDDDEEEEEEDDE